MSGEMILEFFAYHFGYILTLKTNENLPLFGSSKFERAPTPIHQRIGNAPEPALPNSAPIQSTLPAPGDASVSYYRTLCRGLAKM